MPDILGTLKLPVGAGAGKVLTSDANGLASWQTPSGGAGGGTLTEYAWVSTGGATTSVPTGATMQNLPLGATVTKSTDADACYRQNPDNSLTVLQDGWYTITANAGFGATTPSGVGCRIGIWANATDATPAAPMPGIGVIQEQPANASLVGYPAVTHTVRLTANQRIGCSFFHRHSAAVNCACLFFSIARVGAAQGPQGPKGDPGATIGPPLVNNLPANPSDGQEVYYSASGILWHLRYTQAWFDADGYGWVFVGGSPLFTEVLTYETTTSTSYVDLATVGPSITLPLAGVYDIGFGGELQPANVAAADAFMSYAIGAAVATDADSVRHRVAAAIAGYAPGARHSRKTVATVGTALTAKYKEAGGTAGFRNRWMTAQPFRVK